MGQNPSDNPDDTVIPYRDPTGHINLVWFDSDDSCSTMWILTPEQAESLYQDLKAVMEDPNNFNFPPTDR